MLIDEFAEECERISINIRRELKLWGYDPLPVRMLADHMEIKLLTPYDLNMVVADIEQAVCATGWSAITVLTRPYTIIYHPKVTQIQFESNIMHELAHILHKHKPEQLGLISDFRVARKYSKRQEFEADTLGICLQLPQVAVQYIRQHKMTEEQVAKKYYLDLETVAIRLKRLG